MKRFKILILTTLVVTIFSCTKEKPITYAQKSIKNLTLTSKTNVGSGKLEDLATINYQLIDGRLVLNNETDFGNFLNALSDMDLNAWEQSISYNSLRSANNVEQQIIDARVSGTELNLDDIQLATVLNASGIIQVNPYIFKLIPATKKVLVLDVANLSELNDLITATSGSAHIKEFNFDDPVFELLEEGLSSGESAEKSSCRDRHAIKKISGREKRYTCSSITDQCGISTNVQYKYFGISVKLYAEFFSYKYISTPSGLSNTWDYYPAPLVKIDYVAIGTPRCGTTFSISNTYNYWNKSDFKSIYYSSTRDLKTYNLTATFTYTDHCSVVHSLGTFNITD